jgi:teichuronic acid biosynthesis glycosyltransferase TuaC
LPEEEALSIAAIIGSDGAHAPTRAEQLPPLRTEAGAIGVRFSGSIGDYRSGDTLVLRRIRPDELPSVINRDLLVPRPAGRFLFGRLLAVDGDRLQLFPLGCGCHPPDPRSWGMSTGRLRVLSIATLFPDASRPNFGIFVEKSLKALAAQSDVDLTVVAPLGVPPWPLSLHPRYAPRRAIAECEDWRGLPVLRPRWLLWPGMGAARNGPAVARAVLSAVRDLPPFDVVDAQFFHPDAVAAQRVGQALSLPYSIKARGNDIQNWAMRPDTAPAILNAAAGAAGLLSVSAALKAEMIAAGIAADKITLHYTGIDRTMFRVIDQGEARAALGLSAEHKGPVLLTVGTLNQNKGQHLVIEALAEHPGALYLIAGIGPDADRLRALAREKGVADRVRFLGSVDNAALPQLYNASDMMVLASAKEGLANAWVEAMACGTPIIAADIPPAQEAVDTPMAGRIAARTPQAIAAAITDLLAAPRQRDALSAQTHARFSWTANGAALAAYLWQLAGKG